MTTNPQDLDALVRKMQSQIGDDVQEIYSHEALLKLAIDAITTLRRDLLAAEAAATERERADKEAPWQLRRESTMPYQNWRPFNPGDLVEVENGLGDKRMGVVSSFDWGWVPDDPEHVITKARLVARAAPPQLSPIHGEQPRCVPMPTIPVREPAYLVHGGSHPEDDPRNHTLGGGLTKLEWFAGRALPGIIAQPNLEGWDPSVLARWAFEVGTEMVERSKTLNRESP